MRRFATLWAAIAALILPSCLLVAAVSQDATEGAVIRVTLSGPIGPATSQYVVAAIDEAQAVNAQAVLLTIDTPGGLDGAMRDIIKAILASEIPVIGYVSPEGARAASAGAYILMATHVAAMAPATNVGSATPVSIGGGAPPDDGDAPEPDAERPAPAPSDEDAMRNKVVNDAVAYLRGLANRRGRNADWAEAAVREGISTAADEALELGVIDLVADTTDTLLAEADGRLVETAAGERRLALADAPLIDLEPDWRDRLLAIITSPTIAYGLLLVGVYGLLLEGYNPGAIVPGVVGGISLLVGLFALQILPVNYVGLALMALGIVLIIAETLVPSFGALGFGGIAAFVFGSIMLMDTDVPGFGVHLGVIGGLAAGGMLLVALTVFLLLRARRAPVSTGTPAVIGQAVRVTTFAHGEGWAKLGGEHWRIECAAPLMPDQRAVVVAQRGLTLIVEPRPAVGGHPPV